MTNSPAHRGTIAAAKERGVPVIEVEHGDISRWHPAFSWPWWARRMKHRLPVPDYVVTYGSFWSEQLLKNGFWKSNEVLPLGNCRLERFQKERMMAPSRIAHDKSLKRVTCVFTSQKTTKHESILFLEKALELSTAEKLRMFLYIKVHPLEKKIEIDKYKLLERRFPDLCVVCPSTQVSLYDLLSKSDIHLSVYSTCLYESLALGIPTAVLDLSGRDYVAPLTRGGLARLCRSPEELVTFVRDAEIGAAGWKEWKALTAKAKSIIETNNGTEKYVRFLNQVSGSEKSAGNGPTGRHAER